MTDTFLTREETVQLTGRKQPKKQAETLRKNGIPFFTNAAGYPVVSRSAIEGRPHKPDNALESVGLAGYLGSGLVLSPLLVRMRVLPSSCPYFRL